MGVRWSWRAQNERMVQAYMQHLGISPTLARVLIGRDVSLEEAEAFLNPSIKRSLPNPSHLIDMDKAAGRFADSIMKSEPVGIFGDYDVDGATSSALLVRYLRHFGLEAHIYIPDRMKEGYGPNETAMDWFSQQSASLVITVDCGATSYAPLAHAAAIGLEVIVLDHHLGGAELPKAFAVFPLRKSPTLSAGAK